jgi:hypothetical protein
MPMNETIAADGHHVSLIPPAPRTGHGQDLIPQGSGQLLICSLSGSFFGGFVFQKEDASLGNDRIAP